MVGDLFIRLFYSIVQILEYISRYTYEGFYPNQFVRYFTLKFVVVKYSFIL